MHIVCPSCAAMYDVPDRQMKAGRKVRCVGCQHQWVPVMALPDEAPAASAAPVFEPPPPSVSPLPAMTAMDRLAASQPVPQRDRALIGAWIASVVALIVLAAAAYGWRDDLMSIWPASVRLYATLGLVDGP